jgi:hypothetical protein
MMHSTWHSALDPFEACDEIGEIMETLLGDMAGDSFALSWYGFRYILHNWLWTYSHPLPSSGSSKALHALLLIGETKIDLEYRISN